MFFVSREDLPFLLFHQLCDTEGFMLQRLVEMEVKNIPLDDGKKAFDVVDKNDVVILPAFGAAVEEMKILSEKNVQIVDTTCPWVSKVISYFLGSYTRTIFFSFHCIY